MHTIHNLVEYVNLLQEICASSCKMIFRGQTSAEWEIQSSAYRQLLLKYGQPIRPDLLRSYHAELLDGARKIQNSGTENKDDVAVLSLLQHNYAKTLLIDYTYSPLVALWFACEIDETKIETDGCVYAVAESFTQNIFPLMTMDKDYSLHALFNGADRGKIYVYHPHQMNQRIINQQSVFLISGRGFLDKKQQIQIIIPKDAKENIRKSLSLLGITRKTIFPDFMGYIKWFQYDEDSNQVSSLVYQACDLIEDKTLDFIEAKEKLEEALCLLKDRSDNESDSKKAFILHQLGYILYKIGQYDKAMDSLQQSIQAKQKVYGGDENSDIARTMVTEGLIFRKQGDFNKALEMFESAKEILELEKESLALVEVYNYIANIYRDKGDYQTALIVSADAERIVDDYFGRESLKSAYVKNGRGSILAAKGEKANARAMHQSALGIFKKYLGSKHTDIAYTHLKIADVYLLERNKNEWEKSQQYIETAFNILKSMDDQTSPSVILCYANAHLVKAKYLYRKRNFKEAIEECAESIKNGENILGDNHLYLAESYYVMGMIQEKSNNGEIALEKYSKAYHLYGIFNDHPKRPELLKKMENLYQEIGTSDDSFEDWAARNL